MTTLEIRRLNIKGLNYERKSCNLISLKPNAEDKKILLIRFKLGAYIISRSKIIR